MPGKKAAIKKHHIKTAIDFRRWIDKNPNASLKRRSEAFNAIADANFYDTKIKPSNAKTKVK